MSLGFSKFGLWLVLSGFAFSGLLESHVQAQGTQRPHRDIQLSETNSAEILTNLNGLNTKKEGTSQLEDQLENINKQLSNKNLDQGFSLPYLPPTVVPAKTLKELLDRQKNWGMTPEELGSAFGSSESDALSVFDQGRSDAKKSSLQQFYDTLNRQNASHPNSSRSGENGGSVDYFKSDFKQDTDFSDDSSMPASIRDKAKKLRDLVNQDPTSFFNTTKPKTSFDNFLGLNDPNPTADSVRGPKTSMESFMDQFKKVLNGQTVGASVDPSVNALAPKPTVRPVTAYPALDELPSSTHHQLSDITTPGTINSVPNPTVMQDLNSTILNQWNPLYTPPKLELPKPSPPSVPLNMEFPRRKF